MNLDENKYELIELYLQGKLHDSHPFVVQLNEDNILSEEVEYHRLVQNAIVDFNLLDVQAELSEKRVQFEKENRFNWNKTLIAIPIIIMGALFLLTHKNKTIETNGVNPGIKDKKENASFAKNLSKIAKDNKIERKKNIMVPENILSKTNDSISSHENNFVGESIALENKDITNNPSPALVTQSSDKQPLTSQTPISICNDIVLKGSIDAKRPCNNNADGQFIVKYQSGGSSPYQYSIDGIHFQKQDLFENLKEGEYKILIKDVNNCETTLYEKYSLISISCINFAEHVFNPKTNSWEVPTNLEKKGNLTVYDSNGQLVYTKSFEQNEKIYWDGQSNIGNVLEPNIYIYSLKYIDGTVEQGKITIVF